MVWFVPLASLVGRQILKRPILSAAGVVIGWVFIDEKSGEKVAEILPGDLDQTLTDLRDAGIDVGEAIVNATLDVVRGAGRAFIEGLDDTYDYIREKFVVGREPALVTGVTIGFLTILTVVYLYHSVKNAQDAL